MFSGIVEKKAVAERFKKQKNSLKLYFKIPKDWNIKIGESISVDGVCSTLEDIQDTIFSIHYMPETLRKTNLSKLSKSHTFNLERSLTLQSLIGGHLVSGHIDTTAKLVSIRNEGDSKVMKFKLPQKFTRYIVEKGSIAINGVSLTVVSVSMNFFTISLIPYTLSKTNLGQLKQGDKVNIEVDLIAKYLEKLKFFD